MRLGGASSLELVFAGPGLVAAEGAPVPVVPLNSSMAQLAKQASCPSVQKSVPAQPLFGPLCSTGVIA